MVASETIDILWIILCAALVMVMQAGFCLVESGMTRAKNSINVATKNLVDLCVSGIIFWAIGFGLMFGGTVGGWFGASGFMLNGQETPRELAFFLFQLVFCGTATTIISGATAERMHFRGYVAVAALTCAVIYPVFGHWAWGGTNGGARGWLAELGFVDFAGSTVVHSVGGWVALSAIVVLGPRIGKFPSRPRLLDRHRLSAGGGFDQGISGHSLHMATVGVFILWFGWFGFNGGSTLSASDAAIPKILVNTNLSAATGGLAALLFTYIRDGRVVVSQLLVGVVAGLVAITAGCHLMTPLSSILIGGLGAVVACTAVCWLERLRLDDVVGAVPAHAFAGAWGTLAVAAFAPLESLPTGNRFLQMAVQMTGIGAAFIWAFGIGWVGCWLLNRTIGLRVSARKERIGLNYSEHGASTAILDLVAQMHRHRKSRRFNRPVRVDRYTEAGQIGAAYNRVLRRIEEEIGKRDAAERRYRDIVENALEGIFQTSPEGGFRTANPALLEIYGDRSLSDLIRRVRSVSGDLYVDPIRRSDFIRTIAEKGSIRDFRVQIRRADGEIIWVSESAREVKDDAGRLQYYEGTVIDITDRINAERLQRERDFAAAASDAKGQFLARMSHEIRTPLAGVISTLELIDARTPQAQRDRFVDIAKQSARSLLTLINDVLDLSKIESGKLELELVETNLEQLMGSVVDILYHQARSKGLRLAGHIDPQLPSHLLLDDTRLRQVLLNLIGNSIKFTSSGEVTIQLKKVVQTQIPEDQRVSQPIILRIEVADTGIGIPGDKLDAIFEVFTQADRDTTRRFGGSGLGLAICRQLIELMNGRIGVSSSLGGGSLFWIEVPAEPSLKVSNNLMASNPHGIQGQNLILIAPAHAETEFVIRSLNAWGLAVEHFTAVEQFVVTRPQILGANGRDSTSVATITNENLTPDAILIDAELHEQWTGLIDLIECQLPPHIWLGCPPDQHDAAFSLDRPIQASALLNAVMEQLAARSSIESIENDPLNTQVGNGLCVLVADDNEINRIVATEMLQRIGCTVKLACDGVEVIERLRNEPIAMVLIDCEMPVMGGIEATRELRKLHLEGRLALPPHRQLKIIACTAQAMQGDRQKCLAVGMDDYLSKPIRREELVAVLRGAVAVAAPINYDDLVDRCGGDRSVADQVLRVFADRGQADVQSLRSAIHDNSPDVSQIAHRLKGAAATLSAAEISQLAGEIETFARTTQTVGSFEYSDSLQKLETEMYRCISWIEERLARLQL